MNEMFSKVFMEIQKKVAVDAGNYGVSTTCDLRDDGLVGCEEVYEDSLLPLLNVSKRIVLAGYREEWRSKKIRNKKHLERIPAYMDIFDMNVEKVGNIFILSPEAAINHDLKAYWLSPCFYLPRDGRGNYLVRPAVPIIVLDVEKVPIMPIMAHMKFPSSVTGFWSGGSEMSAAGRWIRKHNDEEDRLVYWPFLTLRYIGISGSDAVLEKMVERIMTEGGVLEKFPEFCPTSWINKIKTCQDYESVVDCAGRVFTEI